MAGGVMKSGSAGRGRRRSFRASSEVNITPLVDVMLVLMIIFMVTAPMLTVGVPVDLPKTQAAQMTDETDPLIVSVDASGKVFLQETELTMEMLIGRLMAITGNNPNAKIYVRGDKNLAYGTIMEVMGAISAAGYTKVALIAQLPSPTAVAASKTPRKN
jgi:biopolymer transport protein TolR